MKKENGTAGMIAGIILDASRLLDCVNEAENNLERGEASFLRLNLRGCFNLAHRIERRRQKAERLMRKLCS